MDYPIITKDALEEFYRLVSMYYPYVCCILLSIIIILLGRLVLNERNLLRNHIQMDLLEIQLNAIRATAGHHRLQNNNQNNVLRIREGGIGNNFQVAEVERERVPNIELLEERRNQRSTRRPRPNCPNATKMTRKCAIRRSTLKVNRSDPGRQGRHH